MFLEKEPLQDMHAVYASVNALGKGALGCGGPQEADFKCLWVSEMQM